MRLALQWRPRAEALPPQAVLTQGRGARALARRLLAEPARRCAGLRALASAQALVVLGPRERLPWVDGARYLAPEPRAPGLWLPTTLELWPHPALVLRQLRERAPAPLGLWPQEGVLPLGGARALDPAALRDWLQTREEP